MKLRLVRLSLLLLAPAVFAQTPPAPAPSPPPAKPAKPATGPSFSLLPKSLQKDPYFNFTVVTEMTDEGRKRPAVSPQSPAYYVAISGGFKQLGDAIIGEPTLSEPEMASVLGRSLANAGYYPARRGGKPPSIVIVYIWGSHNTLDHADWSSTGVADGGQGTGGGPESALAKERNMLDRAALVGGDKFSADMLHMLNEEADVKDAQRMGAVMSHGAGAMMDPVRVFRMRDVKNEILWSQTNEDLYFIVATAYDYDAFLKKQRVLLWRTRMTVNASGVTQDQTLPTLALAASRFFGRDMSGPEVLQQTAQAHVDIGTLKVIGVDETPPR